VVVYLAFLAIPLGGLYHVVVSFAETLYLVFAGRLALLTGLTGFVLPVLAGNTVGGVLLVTVVNYFQTTEDRLESARFAGATGSSPSGSGRWAGSSAGRTFRSSTPASIRPPTPRAAGSWSRSRTRAPGRT